MVKNLISKVISLFFILMAGCQVNSEAPQTKKPSEMDPEELLDVRAFDDEFTRGFLQSTEETRSGHYPFLSGTGKYEMDFPAGGIVGEKSYALKEKNYEGLSIGVDNYNGTESYIKINYNSLHEKGREHSILEMMNHQFDGALEFDSFTAENSTLYLSYYEEDETYYAYAVFLQNEVSNGGIKILYETKCVRGKEECKAVITESKDMMRELIDSIQFTGQIKANE